MVKNSLEEDKESETTLESQMTFTNDNIFDSIEKNEKEDHVQEKLKARKSLVLKKDYYSLAFYGFFLESDQEDSSN